MLAFIDLETTGLNPKEDQILEVAIVFTNPWLDAQGEVSCLVKPSRPLVMTPFVAAMHAKSGLLQEINDNIGVLELEGALTFLLLHPLWSALGGKKPRLCGYNPQFDRSFLREQMPRLHDAFHYRSVDTSTLTWALRNWGEKNHEEPKSEGDKHRALPDCHMAIERAKKFIPIFQTWKSTGSVPTFIGLMAEVAKAGSGTT